MPYASVTSNVARCSVDYSAASTAIAETLEESLGFPAQFMMVELNLAVPMILGLNDEPTAYAQVRCIGRIDAERNPKTIAALTKTISEHLKVPAERVYVVLESVKVGNWGANGTTVIPPTN
ncbi:hypothetical protein PRIC1_004867 [Phytophthora ramorum]|uniref:Macrophage migration inhibitory factor n=1 Tax=Phytophthora ramorum TaxID=164328 RepID=UPI0030A9759F|nr:Macrophage migration inhibitory factor [Phytophthora ramorum]